MSVVEPPDRRRKNIVINTTHCRHEVDTVQYVISKYGYRETRQTTDGNILWYGLALRDNDVELIKMKKALINRYPLMDVSNQNSILLTHLFFNVAFRKEKYFLRHYQSFAAIFPDRLSLHA